MPGIAGIYDPEFHVDLRKARQILRNSVGINEDHPQVEIYRPDERICIVSNGNGAIPISAYSIGESQCILFGTVFTTPPNDQGEIREFISSVIQTRADKLDEIDGIFLIVLWNPQEREVLIINDCFGTYPLNYHCENNLLLFSSQLMALRYIIADLYIDEESIAELLSLGFILNGKTLYKKINRLWPGTILRSKQDKIQIKKYFSVSYEPPQKESITERLENFSDLFEKAIHKRYPLQKKCAAGLSGGYDSRVIWSVLKSRFPATTAVTFGEKNAADIEIATRLSRLAGIKHEVVIFDATNFARFYDYLSTVAGITEGYSSFDSFMLIPYYELLRENYSSLIDGTGSALYRRQIFRRYNYLPDSEKDLASFVFKNYMHPFFYTALIKSEFSKKYAAGIRESLANYFMNIKDIGQAEDLLDIFYLHHFVGFRFSADTLLQTYYLETIHPFCDRDLYKSITRFSVEERQKMIVHRYLISRNAKEFEEVPLVGSSLIIPYSNFRIKRIFYIMLSNILQSVHRNITPKALRPRPVFNFDYAFKSFLGKELTDMLTDPLTISRPYWDGQHLVRLLEDHRHGVRNNAKALMQLGLVEMLLRKFG